MKPKRYLILSGLITALLFNGCATRPRNLATDGLPAKQYLVGGGFAIEWTAPNKGTFIVADRTSKKILITRSLNAGDKTQFSIGQESEHQTLERMLGIPLKDTNLQAFWIPAPAKPDQLN